MGSSETSYALYPPTKAWGVGDEAGAGVAEAGARVLREVGVAVLARVGASAEHAANSHTALMLMMAMTRTLRLPRNFSRLGYHLRLAWERPLA